MRLGRVYCDPINSMPSEILVLDIIALIFYAAVSFSNLETFGGYLTATLVINYTRVCWAARLSFDWDGKSRYFCEP
jgi:hypothetical protein